MKVSIGTLSAAVAACCACAAAARADDVTGSLEGGYSYSTGKYGTATTTTIQSLPVTGSLSAGDFSFDVSVPFLSVNGDPNVIPGVGKVNNTNPKKRGKGDATGVGDVTLSASYDFYTNESEKFGLDIEGSAKLGTGDKSQGLGTGATDYTIGIGGYKAIDAVTLLASVGYTAVGSSNFIKLKKNVVSYSLGVSYTVNADWSVGASLESGAQAGPVRARATARSINGAETREATGYFSYALAPNWKLGAYILAGLSTASPDFGTGATITLSF